VDPYRSPNACAESRNAPQTVAEGFEACPILQVRGAKDCASHLGIALRLQPAGVPDERTQLRCNLSAATRGLQVATFDPEFAQAVGLRSAVTVSRRLMVLLVVTPRRRGGGSPLSQLRPRHSRLELAPLRLAYGDDRCSSLWPDTECCHQAGHLGVEVSETWQIPRDLSSIGVEDAGVGTSHLREQASHLAVGRKKVNSDTTDAAGNLKVQRNDAAD
jgi:hypothetical protein